MIQASPLTFGILETDIVAEELRGTFGTYRQMFSELLAKQDPTLQFNYYNVIEGEYPSNIDECDAYLITGSKANSYDNDPWIVRLKEYIKELASEEKKLIGICFGHQLIAHALGGLAGKSAKGWAVGVTTSDLVNPQPSWLSGEKTAFKLLVSHQDQVLQLPDNATLLAGNTFCPYGAYSIDQHILCFQGHPEFHPDYARGLLEKRREIIGETLCEKAITSYSQATDHELVARWILRFVD
ncbi:MAG: GMP synthase-like glutamine amidotransferase [Alteromonadaceae bacterium]|jgi:GMP synthase-like glutamine amidotransferase